MKAPERIDVLAVFAHYAAGFRHLGYPSSADELEEAATCVRELIEASTQLNTAGERFTAALAACTPNGRPQA